VVVSLVVLVVVVVVVDLVASGNLVVQYGMAHKLIII
jgi:hypothetical protein